MTKQGVNIGRRSRVNIPRCLTVCPLRPHDRAKRLLRHESVPGAEGEAVVDGPSALPRPTSLAGSASFGDPEPADRTTSQPMRPTGRGGCGFSAGLPRPGPGQGLLITPARGDQRHPRPGQVRNTGHGAGIAGRFPPSLVWPGSLQGADGNQVREDVNHLYQSVDELPEVAA